MAMWYVTADPTGEPVVYYHNLSTNEAAFCGRTGQKSMDDIILWVIEGGASRPGDFFQFDGGRFLQISRERGVS